MSIRKAKKLFKKLRFTGCGESGYNCNKLYVAKRNINSPWDNGHWSDFYYKRK